MQECEQCGWGPEWHHPKLGCPYPFKRERQMTTTEAIARHKGPFTLMVTRPARAKAKNPFIFTTEWLKGTSHAEDIEDEAIALLTDPADTITSVGIWSIPEGHFVGTYNKE